MKRRFWLGISAGAICALIWGGQAVVTRRSVFDGLTPADVRVLRYLVAGVAVLPLSLRRRPFPVGLLGWRRALALAILAGTPYSLIVVGGVAFAPALHSAVITFGVIPIASTAHAYLAFREQPGLPRVAYLALILAGLVLFGWESLNTARASAWRGYLLFVLSVVDRHRDARSAFHFPIWTPIPTLSSPLSPPLSEHYPGTTTRDGARMRV